VLHTRIGRLPALVHRVDIPPGKYLEKRPFTAYFQRLSSQAALTSLVRMLEYRTLGLVLVEDIRSRTSRKNDVLGMRVFKVVPKSACFHHN
jgi:hypothetical protein